MAGSTGGSLGGTGTAERAAPKTLSPVRRALDRSHAVKCGAMFVPRIARKALGAWITISLCWVDEEL